MINFIDEYGKQHAAIVECQKTKGVNGEKSLSGTIYTNDEILEGIGRGWRLQFEEENYCLTYVNPIDEGNRIVVEFDAVHEFFFDLRKSVIYSEMNGSNTANAYLQFIFNGSGYEYRLEVTIPSFEKESFGMKNRLDLFKDFISSTGVEFSVNGKIVRILEKVGTNLSTIVKKGFNLNELRIEKDPGSFITYLRGYGAFFDPDDESKGRLIVEYLSPLAELYGKLEGDPIVDERYKVESNFIDRLKNDVESSYGISVDIDMEDLTKAGYEYDQPHEGDYIMAINKDLEFEQKIRIMSYTTSYDTEGNIIDHDVSCGSDNIIQKKINQENEYRKEVQAGLENAISTANQAWISADGKNKVFQGPDRPTATNKGDIWYQVDGEQTIMNYWDGFDWVPFINPDAVKESVDQAKQAGEQAQAAAEQATEDAQAAKAKADAIQIDVNSLVSDVATINGNVTTISSKANEAYSKAQAVEGKTVSLENTVSGFTGRLTDIETVSDDTTKKVNELEVTVDGHTQLIASTKMTADSALTKATQVETTANGLKTTISSVETTASNALTKATQVEATASGIRQTVTEVQGNIADLVNKFPDPDFKKQNPKPTIEGYGITGQYDASGFLIDNTSGTAKQRVYWGATPVALTVGKTYNIKLYMNTGSTGGTVEIGSAEGENIKVTPRAGYLTWVQGTIKATTYTAFSIWVEAGKAVRLRELYIYEANTDVTSAQFTQLSDTINFKVSKGDVINQINVSTESILISGNKVHITGQTTIDNGVIKTAQIADLSVSTAKIANAAITDAKIGSLSATKITTGTLNAANVNIINLNANSITTGTISGTNLSINLATGEVIFNKGIIKNLDDTFQMNITTGVTASRGEYLSPNDTGNTLAAGYNLMNGKIEFYTGTFGEATVSYGGLTTETHSGQYKENGIWQAGMWSGNRPAIALKMANPNTSVWQSVHRAVLLSSTEYQEPFSSSFFTDATWLGYGDKSGADTKQNIRGAGIGVKQSGSDVNKDESGGLFSEAWVIARHGVYLASGYAYDSTISGRRYLAPTIRLGTSKVNSGASESIKQMASTATITAGYKIAMQSKYIDLWAGDSGEITLNAQRTDINGGGDSSLYGGISFGADSNGARVWSKSIYNKTYSSGPQVCVTSYGTLGRITSARKYKMNIQVANKIVADAKKILEINPVSWIDKFELSSGNVKGRYYGFIADEFHEKGMTEVVFYDEKGQVEGLAYDRLTMYHNVILSDHEREVQLLKQEVEQLKIRVQELEAA